MSSIDLIVNRQIRLCAKPAVGNQYDIEMPLNEKKMQSMIDSNYTNTNRDKCIYRIIITEWNA